jgi:hypothetical protein
VSREIADQGEDLAGQYSVIRAVQLTARYLVVASDGAGFNTDTWWVVVPPLPNARYPTELSVVLCHAARLRHPVAPNATPMPRARLSVQPACALSRHLPQQCTV